MSFKISCAPGPRQRREALIPEETTLVNVIEVLGPLIGVVVGGLVTYFVSSARDKESWRRSRREKLSELEREAIGAALEWIEPMRNAHTEASSLTVRALHGEVSREALLKEWPHLLGQLRRLDLSGTLRAVLPEDAYPRGAAIARRLEDLHHLAIDYGQRVEVSGQPLIGLQKCSEMMSEIGAAISELEHDLRARFRASFG